MSYTYEPPCPGGNLMSTQISSLLIHELREGEFAAAERLPSEVELAQRLGVSRTVIRDALSDLEREGMVERVRGIGTVINRDIVRLENRLDLKVEYYDLIRSSGCRPSSDSIQLRLEPASQEMADKLDIDVDEMLIVCEKRVLAGDIPVIYSVDSLPRSLIDVPDYTVIDWSQPIFDILDRYCGMIVISSICRVRAVMGPPEIRRRLALPEGEALLELEELGSGKLGRPVMHSTGHYTSFFDFTMLRKKF